VRACDLLDHLVRPGLASGAIASLKEERDLLRQYLGEFPFSDAGFYAAYKSIRQEGDPARRRERTAALRAELDGLVAAIRAGEAGEERLRSPHFPMALLHVFPPSVTVDRNRVAEMVRRWPDHPEHVLRLDPGPLQGRRVAFPRGGYAIRAGAAIDPEPWAPLRRIVEQAGTGLAPEAPPARLGRLAMQGWERGVLARDPEKSELLAAAYARARAGGAGLPERPGSAEELVAYEEFLEDRIRDVLEEALGAFRAEAPEEYERIRRARLAPPVRPGKGLVREVWRTVEAFRSGALAAADASARLARQTREFSCRGGDLLEFLSAARSAGELEDRLGDLSRGEIGLQPGKEVRRVWGELCGSDAAAMHRELFGGAGSPAKVEYRSEGGGPALELAFEVTKRRVHAPVGFCEGVCTATDEALWDRPEFLQTVFWGPGGTALGGMHLLIVEEGGRRFLSLPGINPSARLLALVEAGKVLSACLDFARALSRRWGMGGVWIPSAPWIHSNRAAIQKAVQDRGFEERAIAEQPFSFSPYAYAFKEVLVVPEEE
jgi:hypothetical protein